MKLVVTYTTTDGCTFSADHVIPVEFESPEALLVAFDEAIQRCRKDPRIDQIFQIGNQHFDAYSFKDCESMEYTLPTIYTLEEWFDRYSKS